MLRIPNPKQSAGAIGKIDVGRLGDRCPEWFLLCIGQEVQPALMKPGRPGDGTTLVPLIALGDSMQPAPKHNNPAK